MSAKSCVRGSKHANFECFELPLAKQAILLESGGPPLGATVLLNAAGS